jgi:tyrosine-protein kinase Etk/Wzc
MKREEEMSVVGLNPKKDQVMEEGLDPYNLAMILWGERKGILLFSCIVTLMAILDQVFLAPVIFRSDALIVSVGATQTSSKFEGFGGLAHMVGMELPEQVNTLELILKSRSFALELARKIHLPKKWGESELACVRRMKSDHLIIQTSKSGPQISIAWEDQSPEFSKSAIEVALKILEERMVSYTNRKKRHRVKFLEARTEEARRELIHSEEDLLRYQKKNQGIAIEEQAKSILNQLNLLKIKRQEKALELSSYKEIFSEGSNETEKLRRNLSSIDLKIKEIIGSEENSQAGLATRTLMEIPGLGLEYSRMMRAVILNQKVFGLLVEQLEMNKIDSLKDSETFEVLDPPVVPDYRVRPKRTVAVVAVGVTALLFASVFTWVLYYIRRRTQVMMLAEVDVETRESRV